MSTIGVIKAKQMRAVCTACGGKGLGISEEERRALQQQITGKASLKEMSLNEVGQVLDHLNRLLGARRVVGNEWSFVFKLTPARQIHAKKIFRLAERVGKLLTPPVPVASKAYIEGITAQMRGATQPLEFCDPEQLHKVVQALEIYVKRHGAASTSSGQV